MERISIKSWHKSLSEAVVAANQHVPSDSVARRHINDLDSGNDGKKVWEAYVTDRGVFFIYTDEDEARILSPFPFSPSETGCYSIVMIDTANNQFIISDPEILKTGEQKRAATALNLILY